MSTTTEMDAALKTYRGSCHCQAVVFSVTLPDIAHEKADNGVCDCSFCAKRAVIWAFAEPGALEFEKGLDGMKGYQFGAKSTTHYHCENCGTYIIGCPFSKDMKMPLNIRAIRGVDLWSLPTKKYSGVDRKPAYVPPTTPAHNFVPADGKKIYTGGCHCGAAKFALLSEPLEQATHARVESEVCDCNCSLCSGNGVLWIYPELKDIAFSPTPLGDAALKDYFFGKKQNAHRFCTTCGVNVYERRPKSPSIGLNLRLVEDVELVNLKIKKEDELANDTEETAYKLP